MSGIHHFVPVLHRGDAVGRHTLRLRDATRARGVHSEIFVDTIDDDTAGETVAVLSYVDMAQPGDVVVYQFATASAMAPWLASPSRDPRGQLPQRHATRADGALGQPPRPRAAAGAGGPPPARAAHRAGGGGLGLQRGAPGRLRVRGHGGDLAVGRTRHRAHRRRGRAARRRCTTPWRALAGHRPGLAQQGPREHHRRPGGHPRPGQRRRHASHRRQAGDGFLRQRVAPLRGRARPGPRRTVRRSRQRCHRRRGLRQRGRAGRDVGARGFLRARRRGDVRRRTRRGLRSGCGSRGARRVGSPRRATRTRSRWLLPSRHS